MDQIRTPLWQKLLPFLVLIPSAVVTNGSLISLLIVVVTLVAVKSSRQPTLAFVDDRWLHAALLGIGGGLLLWFLSDQVWEPILQQWLGPIKLDSVAGVRGNALNFVLLLAIGLTYGGVIEEVIFRGFVIGWGSRLIGEHWAVPLALLSSVVFGGAHFYQGISGAISTGLIGLGLALLYLGTGKRLLAPMLAHMTLDAIGITQLYLGINS